MVNSRASTLQVMGAALLIGGLVLAVMPTVAIRAVDGVAARMRSVAASDWIERQRPSVVAGRDAAWAQAFPPESSAELPAPAASPGVIEPGPDGYLLEIPKLGLRAVVRELEPEVFSGRNTRMLKRFGLGQVPYSEGLKNVSPGAEGAAVIAGHRTTSGAPFRNLDRLGPGDLIIIRKGDAKQRWTVVYSITVAPSDVDAIRSQPGTRRLAILACSPPFSDARRLIVYAAPADEEVP